MDSHVTYFDTSFTPEHLPPELKLGASRNSQFNSLDTQNNTTPKLPYHPAIELDYDESRSRIKMLEEQAEALKQKYCLMKRRLSSGRQRFTKSIHFEDELPEWKYKSSSRLSDSADSFPKFMSATVSANPQEVSVVDASFSKLWTDDRQIISGLIPESGFSDTAEYAENSLMAVREVASTPLVRPRLMSEISSFRRLNFELNNEQVLSEKDVWINSPLNQDKFSFSSQMLERKIEEMDVLQPLSSNSFKRDKFKLNLSSLKPQHMDDFTANVESATPEIHPNIDKEIPLESISKYFTSATITKPDGLTDKETVDKDIDVHEVVEDNDITFPTQVNLDAAWNASHGTMKMKDVDQSPLRMQTLTTNKKSTEPGTELLSKHLINLKPEEPRLSGRSSQISVTHEEINPAQVIKTASFVSSEKMIKEPLEIRPDLDALWKSTNEKLKLSDKNEEQQVNRSSGELPAVMKSMAVIEAADPSKDEMKERTVETNLLKEVPLVLPLLNSTHSASVKLNDATDKETFDRDKFSTMQDALSEENMLISPVQAQLNLDAAWKGSRNKKEINVGGENKFGQLDTPIGLPSHSEAIRSETEVKNSQVYQVSDIAAKGIDLSPLGDEHSDDQISWEKSGVASPNDDFEW